MLKRICALSGLLLLICAAWIPPVDAGVPKIIVAEEFGATW